MQYLMKHKILYLCVAVAAMFSACGDDLEDSTFSITEEVPAATWLQENGYTQWVALLNHTNMVSTINLNVGDYTLFVPDNEAVNKYLAANGYGSVQDIDPAYGQYLVKYHTIAGNQYSQVDFSNDVLPDTTATGDRLSVTFNENGDYFVNEEAQITSFDIATTNATVFIMNGVLTPITEYIYDRLEDNADWSLFKELLDATGLSPLVSSTSGRAASYTCLVVPNSVFDASAISSLAALADTLDAGQNTAAWTDPENAMYRYAAYHLISSSHATGSIVVADTASASSAATVLATLAEASYIEFQDIDGQLYINYDTLTNTGATWGGVTDLVCRNGECFDIYDWKRSAKLPDTNRWQRGWKGLEHLEDTSYNHYCLQQNLYRYILEHNYGLRIGNMHLVAFHPDLASFKLMRVPRMDKEIEHMLMHRND